MALSLFRRYSGVDVIAEDALVNGFCPEPYYWPVSISLMLTDELVAEDHWHATRYECRYGM